MTSQSVLFQIVWIKLGSQILLIKILD